MEKSVKNIYELLATASKLFVEVANNDSETGKALLLADNDNGHAIDRLRIYIVPKKNYTRINVWVGNNYPNSALVTLKNGRAMNGVETKYTRIAESDAIELIQRISKTRQAVKKEATKKSNVKVG